MDKYSWNFDGDAERWDESANTVEECLAQAKEAIANGEAKPTDTVYIGKNIPFKPWADAESVLEAIETQANDFAGEVAEDWETFDPRKDGAIVDALSDAITDVVNKWLKKYNREPYFWRIEGIKAYTIKL